MAKYYVREAVNLTLAVEVGPHLFQCLEKALKAGLVALETPVITASDHPIELDKLAGGQIDLLVYLGLLALDLPKYPVSFLHVEEVCREDPLVPLIVRSGLAPREVWTCLQGRFSLKNELASFPATSPFNQSLVVRPRAGNLGIKWNRTDHRLSRPAG